MKCLILFNNAILPHIAQGNISACLLIQADRRKEFDAFENEMNNTIPLIYENNYWAQVFHFKQPYVIRVWNKEGRLLKEINFIDRSFKLILDKFINSYNSSELLN